MTYLFERHRVLICFRLIADNRLNRCWRADVGGRKGKRIILRFRTSAVSESGVCVCVGELEGVWRRDNVLGNCRFRKHQHINISAPTINTSTHQHISKCVNTVMNTSTRRHHNNTSTHQHIDTSTQSPTQSSTQCHQLTHQRVNTSTPQPMHQHSHQQSNVNIITKTSALTHTSTLDTSTHQRANTLTHRQHVNTVVNNQRINTVPTRQHSHQHINTVINTSTHQQHATSILHQHNHRFNVHGGQCVLLYSRFKTWVSLKN
jgi:hypothetical protein